MITRGTLDLLFVELGRRRDSELVGLLHFMKLRGGTSGDLLGAQLAQLCFEVHELLLEIILALAPELAGADFCGRL